MCQDGVRKLEREELFYLQNTKQRGVTGIYEDDKHTDRKKERKKEDAQSFFLFLSGHKCRVSTRGKCSNSPISLHERARRFLPSFLHSSCLSLSASALGCPDFLPISRSLFDLRCGDTTPSPCSPHAGLTILLPLPHYAECLQSTPRSRSFIQG